MWLAVEHRTRFSYDAPIVEAHTELRLKPAHMHGQRCSSFRVATEPQVGAVDEHFDRFANSVHHFDVLEPHSQLVVDVASEVSTADRYEDETPLSPLDRWDLLQPTRYVPLDGLIAELADRVHNHEDPLATAHALMRAVRSAMKYERGTTNVHTRADEALADRRGVCQDFAHVLIGVCRARGLPARYVSGYLFDPRTNGNGEEGASHAWVDVYDGDRGWLSLDPTHDTEQTANYIRVGVGRDYDDVPPTRGVYRGDANETLDVSVVVRAL